MWEPRSPNISPGLLAGGLLLPSVHLSVQHHPRGEKLCKGSESKYLGFAAHIVFPCVMKATTDDVQMSGCGRCPVKVYL